MAAIPASAAQSTNAGFAKVRQEGASDSAKNLDYEPMVADLRHNFEAGTTKDLEWRRRQLRQIMRMIEENHEEITAAIRADHGGPKIRGLGELGAHKAAESALANLDDWTKPQ